MAKKNKVRTRQEKNKEFLENRDFDRLLTNNKPFIHKIALSKSQPHLLEDLLHMGSIGLWYAFNNFDPNNGAGFLTYAQYHINKQMNEFLNSCSRTIYHPNNALAAKVYTNTISANTPINENGDILEHLLPSEASDVPFEKYGIREAINALKKDSDKDIIRMRYGIEPYEKEYNLREISEKHQCTKENIRVRIIYIQNVLKDDRRIQEAKSTNQR